MEEERLMMCSANFRLAAWILIAAMTRCSMASPPDIEVPVHWSTVTSHLESASRVAASVMRGISCSSGALCRLVMPMRVKCGTTPAGMNRCICGSTIRFDEGMMKPMRARGTMGS